MAVTDVRPLSPASIGLRVAAFAIDLVLWALFSLALSKLWVDEQDVLPTALFYAYSITLHWLFGATLGKMIVGLKVKTFPTGLPISLLASFVRDVAYVLLFAASILLPFLIESSSALVDWLMPLFFACDAVVALASKSNRALHDLLASTIVVKSSRSR